MCQLSQLFLGVKNFNFITSPYINFVLTSANLERLSLSQSLAWTDFTETFNFTCSRFTVPMALIL